MHHIYENYQDKGKLNMISPPPFLLQQQEGRLLNSPLHPLCVSQSIMSFNIHVFCEWTSAITSSVPHKALCYTLLLSTTLQIVDFFFPVAYTKVLIWSYIKNRLKLHATVNHQGNRELFTTLQCSFSISEALKRCYWEQKRKYFQKSVRRCESNYC